jgi:ketosteroid isomerase-like protein
MADPDNIFLLRAYLDALESHDHDALARALHPDIVYHEHPNKLAGRGGTRDRATMLEGSRRGQAAVTGQRYEIRSTVCAGDQIAAQIRWTARSQVPIAALGREAGDLVEADFAIFVTFRDGQVFRQDNYDCFLP